MAISMLKDGKITPLEEERGDASPRTEQEEAANQGVERGDASPRTEQEGEEQAQDAAELLKNSPPEDPLAAAIDRATGFADAAKAGAKVRLPVVRRDWVEEAYKCFIKDAGDIDPTDPISAIAHYFAKNATPELKARCEKEGKNATGCWRFIEAVARKALHGSSGHIDPAVVYAIAMHWFEDVPKDWDKPAPSPKPAKASTPAKTTKPKKPAETPSEIKKEKAKAKAAKKRKSKAQQGFFFEMLETPVEGGTEK